jgi:hypothetical protein
LAGGFFGFFSDINPNEGPFERALYIWFFFFLGGLYVGILLPRVWYLAILISWFPITWIIPVFQYSREISEYNAYAWWIGFNTTLISPLVALLSGYLGSRINRSFYTKAKVRTKYIIYILISILAAPPLLLSSAAVKFFIEERRSPSYEYIGMGDPPYMMAGPSPLHVAAEQGNLMEITRLIEEGEDVNIRDMAGRTPLHYAVGEQQVDAVKLLLSNGAVPDIKDDEYQVTPLHWAAGSGNIDIVKLLAPRVKDIDARNKDGQTAAEIAYIDHEEEILRILIEYGAKLDINEQEPKK